MAHHPPISAERLRAAAEGMIPEAERRENTSVLHELRVHQIELEMQNEALRQSQTLLEAARDQYRDLFDRAPVGYLTITGAGLIHEANATALALLGLDAASIRHKRFEYCIAECDRHRWNLLFARVRRNFEAKSGEFLIVKNPDAHVDAWIDCVHHAFAGEWVRVTIADISDRKRFEAQLELTSSVFTHAHEGVMITDPCGAILQVNRAFTEITGYEADEVLGKNPRLLGAGDVDPLFFAEMWRALTERHFWQSEMRNRRKDGSIFIANQTITAVRDASGKVQHYVSIFGDVTIAREHDRQMEFLAHHDVLTGLPNRALLADRLNLAMMQAVRRGQRLAVVYLDLDLFKEVNDHHGHEAGDLVLRSIARRVMEVLREGDTLARIGGDEFIAVLVDLDDTTDTLPLLERIIAATGEAIVVNGLSLAVSASVGVSYFPQPLELSADQLLRQADQAMYQAKLQGRNRYHVFDTATDAALRGQNVQLERLEAALAKHEFILHYQPKVNLRTGALVGAEALIRWQHPDQGLLAPALFLPVMEGHPLSERLGEWVMATALSQVATWQAEGLNIPVSVNIAAHQLQQVHFVDRLSAALERCPCVSPSMLTLEILETSALEDIAGVTLMIEACARLGVRFALDDFGTGYSSLMYLKRLPVAQLKIDQSFVRGMLDNADDLAILQGVLGLAAAFKLEVIAEGVETLGHGKRLLELGCELGQGYAFARPMAAADIGTWLASRHV